MGLSYNENMLRTLSIENFILIDQLHLDLSRGVTAFTGETGAGKSMILDAIAAVIGGRVSADWIRAGAKRASIEAEFQLSSDLQKALTPCLEEAGIDQEELGRLRISREINERGGKCRVDDQPLSLQALRPIGERLVDILGQHEHQHLTKPSNHLSLLDSYGGLDAQAVRRAFEEWKSLVAERKALLEQQEARERERELLQFQLEELDGAQLSDEEEEPLKAEQVVLAHAEELVQKLNAGYHRLMDEDGGFDALSRVSRDLEQAVRFDPSLEELLASYQTLVEEVHGVGRELRDRADRVEPDPERLDEIETRLDLLTRLKRKYHAELPGLIELREGIRSQLEAGLVLDQRLADLESLIDASRARLEQVSDALSLRRKEAAKKLQEGIERELRDLGMPGTVFLVSLEPREIGMHGQDEIEFLIAPNPGEPPRPLARIASGGELARLMLAFKTVLAESDPIPTLIFDEVDAGISGKAAQAVAEKIARLGERFQILLVTHLAAIAAAADHHDFLEKVVEDGRTNVKTTLLDREGRIEAIARLIDGNPTPTSRKHAEELLSRLKKVSP